MKSCLKLAFALLVAALPLLADAKDDRIISDPIGIRKLVHSIRTFQGDLGSRLVAGGMGVESIRIHSMTTDDVAEDPLSFASGDTEIHINMSGRPDAAGCKILGSPTFIRRGKRYIAQDRTGVWLLTGKCALPD